MFKSKNFCHIASNNRNNVKVGVFTYRTTDDLATITATGYFNERIIDINLHDMIIHEQVDRLDNTKVKYNLLCVTERTLENVGTTVLKRDIDEDIEDAIEDLQTYVNNNFVKIDGSSTMTGVLKMRASVSFECAVAPYWHGVGLYKLNDDDSVTLLASMEANDGWEPGTNNTYNMGSATKKWKNLYLAGKAYIPVINNGYDIAVPVTSQADTLALKSEVDLAANSGRMITDQGVWYAKMYAATVVPTGAEYDGRNYADFSETDSGGNPVIKIYTGASGSWTLSETITPPAEYDGYVPITSKIWDIPEQSGQQGGRILWNHQSKDFTPYPQIISFENAALTGVPTAPLPTGTSPNNQIATKEYVDDLVVNSGTGRNVGDIFTTMRIDNSLNGAVECNGAIYNTTDFIGAQSIGELLEDGKIPYVSMLNYATDISTKGWCDKIGWDGTGNTTFKVPTLNAYIWQKLQEQIIGTGMTLGLTNGVTNVGLSVRSGEGDGNQHLPNGNAYGINVSTTGAAAWDNYGCFGVTSDPTKSGIEVDTTDNVAQLRVMIQLTISATDEAVATCTAVTSQVAANTAALAGADYVIESQLPTAQNNYTWYRKYKSGWVEQGGIQTGTGSYGTVTINLPIEMADTNYCVTASLHNWSTSHGWYTSTGGVDQRAMTDLAATPADMTTTSFAIQSIDAHCWKVEGMAA